MTLRCGATSVAVAEGLRAAGAEWRESRLSPAARAAGIFGWTVRVRDTRIVVRALIGGRNSFLPHFVGRLHATDTGSILVGELRLSWFPRVFMLIWLSLAGGAPIIALLGPRPDAGVGERVFAALFMLLPAIALFSFGLWMVRRGWTAPAVAFKEFLERVCNPPGETGASSPTREASNVR